MKESHKYLFIILVIMILVLAGGYVVYKIYGMSFDYLIYSIKTLGQEKYKLTVNVEYERNGDPAYYAPVEIIQEVDLSEKEERITGKRTGINAKAVFYLSPGTYKCRGGQNLLGSTRYIVLDENKEVTLKVLIPIQ